MTAGSAMRIVKQYRFELGLAIVLSFVVAALAAIVNGRLSAISIPVGCSGIPGESASLGNTCLAALQEYSRIYFDEASRVLAAMAVLPIAVGVLAGVPIVGRELEAGTAQFSWAISPSRHRWLAGQLAVVGIVVIVGVGVGAALTQVLEGSRQQLIPSSAFQNLGLHGPLVVARAIASLTVGLLLGAITGRTLPAFIVGAVAMAAMLALASGVRDIWAAAQPAVVVEDPSSGGYDGQITATAWIEPGGSLIAYEDGIARAPGDAVDGPDAWLWQNGYRQVQLGITRATASAWTPIETGGWVVVGVIALGAGAWVTSKQRPR
jgi:hypothetical protein